VGLKGADTLAAIGISAFSPATVTSPPGRYPIDVIGAPRNYALAATAGTLTVEPRIEAVLTSEQLAVPILGGLVQQGVGSGVTAVADTLGLRPGDAGLLVETSRFSIRLDSGFARPGVRGALTGLQR
jgi:hypothetical protein